MSIRVIIADDHPLVRDGLRFSIERSGQGIVVAGEATHGEEILDMVARGVTADVYIIDVTMPKLNGIETTRELLRRHPKAKVIVLSFHDTRAMVEAALEAGARGYLTKEAASRTVVEAIGKVHGGGVYLSPDVAPFAADRFLSEAPPVRAPKRTSVMTGRERKVLQMIAEGHTNKEIATELGLATNTIHAHRNNLMAKLNIHKQTELVRYAIKEGIAKL